MRKLLVLLAFLFIGASLKSQDFLIDTVGFRGETDPGFQQLMSSGLSEIHINARSKDVRFILKLSVNGKERKHWYSLKKSVSILPRIDTTDYVITMIDETSEGFIFELRPMKYDDKRFVTLSFRKKEDIDWFFVEFAHSTMIFHIADFYDEKLRREIKN